MPPLLSFLVATLVVLVTGGSFFLEIEEANIDLWDPSITKRDGSRIDKEIHVDGSKREKQKLDNVVKPGKTKVHTEPVNEPAERKQKTSTPSTTTDPAVERTSTKVEQPCERRTDHNSHICSADKDGKEDVSFSASSAAVTRSKAVQDTVLHKKLFKSRFMYTVPASIIDLMTDEEYGTMGETKFLSSIKGLLKKQDIGHLKIPLQWPSNTLFDLRKNSTTAELMEKNLHMKSRSVMEDNDFRLRLLIHSGISAEPDKESEKNETFLMFQSKNFEYNPNSGKFRVAKLDLEKYFHLKDFRSLLDARADFRSKPLKYPEEENPMLSLHTITLHIDPYRHISALLAFQKVTMATHGMLKQIENFWKQTYDEFYSFVRNLQWFSMEAEKEGIGGVNFILADPPNLNITSDLITRFAQSDLKELNQFEIREKVIQILEELPENEEGGLLLEAEKDLVVSRLRHIERYRIDSEKSVLVNMLTKWKTLMINAVVNGRRNAIADVLKKNDLPSPKPYVFSSINAGLVDFVYQRLEKNPDYITVPPGVGQSDSAVDAQNSNGDDHLPFHNPDLCFNQIAENHFEKIRGPKGEDFSNVVGEEIKNGTVSYVRHKGIYEKYMTDKQAVKSYRKKHLRSRGNLDIVQKARGMCLKKSRKDFKVELINIEGRKMNLKSMLQVYNLTGLATEYFGTAEVSSAIATASTKNTNAITDFLYSLYSRDFDESNLGSPWNGERMRHERPQLFFERKLTYLQNLWFRFQWNKGEDAGESNIPEMGILLDEEHRKDDESRFDAMNNRLILDSVSSYDDLKIAFDFGVAFVGIENDVLEAASVADDGSKKM